MSILSDLIATAGDQAKEQLKNELLARIEDAKARPEAAVKEFANKLESWLQATIEDELDTDELELLIQAEKRKLEQYVNTLEITARAKLETYTLQLADMVLDKALGKLV